MSRTQYVKGRDGKFQGSIGAGIAPPHSRPAQHPNPDVNLTVPDPGSAVTSAYEKFRVAANTGSNPWGMDRDVLTTKTDSREERVKNILGELETGVGSLATSEGFRAFLDTCAKFHSYSTNNQLLIAAQNPDAERVAGFTGWKKLGRHVKKGEKGLVILRPLTVKKTRKDDTGKPVLGDDGKPVKTSQMIGFAPAYVFDVSQTEGEPLPESPTVLLSGNQTVPDGLQERLDAAIREQGFTVSRERLPAGVNGYTSHEEKKVVVAEGLSPAQTAKTTAHELGHVVAHADEDHSNYHSGPGGCRGRMEVEAEAVAYVVCKASGMDTKDYTFGYVAQWGESQDGDAVKTIRRTAETIRTTAHTILESMGTSGVSSDDE